MIDTGIVTTAAAAKPADRQKTYTELEMATGRKAVERRTAQLAVPVAPRGVTGPATNDNAKASGVTGPSHMPTHDKDMARGFLAGLDPNASNFTFQFFGDGAGAYAEIFHETLDAVWPKVQVLNTPTRRCGVFVTINETDFKGRRTENIVRPRALFVDGDSDEQVKHCIKKLYACGAAPSRTVKSGRGLHFYFFVDDIPLDQFTTLQKSLIQKVGTDPAVHDLSRVMRLPGTLHLKDPTNPRLVKLSRSKKSPRWKLADLISTLGLSLTTATAGTPKKTNGATNVIPFLNAKPAAAFAALDAVESLADGLGYDDRPLDLTPLVADTGCGFIREAMATGGKDYAQPLWNLTTLVATFLEDGHALAHRMGNQHPGYNPETTDALWERKLHERKDRGLGWPSCNAIQAAGCTDCTTCPHLLKGKSPLHLTVSAAVTAPVANTSALLAANPIQAGVIDPAAFRVSFSGIRHRQWLYGVELVRGDIAVTASPGGAGKTSLAIGMAVCIAAGKAHLGEKIWGAGDLKALYINAEDSGVEMRRRVLAFCQHHNIAEQDISRLYVAGTDDPQVQHLSLLRTTDKNLSVLNLEGFKPLDSLLVALRPDLVILDPLVALCGGGNVNDNAVMSLVMRELKSVAIKFNCAVLIIHHTRKGGDLTNAEAISGASAIVNLARHASMPVTMTDDEAKWWGVLPSQRLQYFKLVDAKSNLSPRSAEAPWYKLASEELPNAEPPTYPHGDRVQAVTRAELTREKTSPFAGPEQQTIRFKILKLIDRGITIDGEQAPYTPNSNGKNKTRAILDDAMAVVEQATKDQDRPPVDLRAVTEREIEALKHEGWVVVESIKKGRFRRSHGLRVVWERTPWAKERDNLHQHGGPTVRTEEEEQELVLADFKKGLGS